MNRLKWNWIIVAFILAIVFLWVFGADAQEKSMPANTQEITVSIEKLNAQVSQWNSRLEEIDKGLAQLDTEKKQLQGAIYALTNQIKTLLATPDSVKAKMNRAAEASKK